MKEQGMLFRIRSFQNVSAPVLILCGREKEFQLELSELSGQFSGMAYCFLNETIAPALVNVTFNDV